jgi:hypothetical protein
MPNPPAFVSKIRPTPPKLPRLTRQDRRLLELLAQGKTTMEIAAVLGLQEKFVDAFRDYFLQSAGAESPPPLDSEVAESALRRIGAAAQPPRLGRLNTMTWFVELTQANLSAYTPAEMLAKQEEFAALERYLGVNLSPRLAKREDVEQLKLEAGKALLELLNTGFITLGPFQMTVSIWVRSKHPQGQNHQAIEASSCERKDDRGRQGLFREMAFLLKEFAPAIARCPRCARIFVKPRVNAEFCSRTCQNTLYMQKRRKASIVDAKGGGIQHGKAKRAR